MITSLGRLKLGYESIGGMPKNARWATSSLSRLVPSG